MPRMGKHSPTEAAGRRARACAWAVFIGMAGTTMSFQVYHSIERGQMPWPLAVLYGVVPLVISMLIIEFASGRARWAAYLIMGGAMYLSAAATGAVVLKAAPPHSSLLFGLLLDGAAILAARFLMTGASRAARAEIATLERAAAAERQARLGAEAERAAERDALTGELASVREELARAEARAESLARKLAAAGNGQGGNRKRKPPADGSGNGTRERKPETETIEDPPADLDSELKVLWYLDRGLNPSQAGKRAGLTDRRGRQIASLREPAPKGIDEGSS